MVDNVARCICQALPTGVGSGEARSTSDTASHACGAQPAAAATADAVPASPAHAATR